MFAIQNYGLLWERKYIFWGWSGVAGHLNGERNNKNADFRWQSGVYILYDKDMSPVYVGQAGKGADSLFTRLKAHTGNHLWNRWSYFSWFGLCKVNKDGSLSQSDNPTRKISGSLADALNDIEGVLILGIEPRLNKQGPKFKGVQQWHQSVDSRITEITTHELLEKLQKIEDLLNAGD